MILALKLAGAIPLIAVALVAPWYGMALVGVVLLLAGVYMLADAFGMVK